MSHNYATPQTPEKRLARILARLPADWPLTIERQPDTGWRARLTLPVQGMQEWTAPHPTLLAALEDAWRHARDITTAATSTGDTVKK
ncbi:hypothetical protein CFR78_00195 [Komagataeibacter rhaeticus]|uniref:Uncharacterized protein n=1 Tax=Komagataeibacter rhaeticus TaxID=215221 RepID=A0A181CE70_9PROT|nr:hypothetical protein [Komagataeibacter rhaeticus]ATU74037.1 hypothetical protein CT154_15670 [Komagataeibacter xylinus]EGG77908.1 hypothetical protein SXCC_01301 [Gluconacetobacter sp. SXCC-1]KDU97589.1 hypothetical protein GLUCORHAEAF1_16530 [Komagataeibacter rhaeticus AF1]MBL7240875.1 hypothetical protein [Komagataeibacter rhaeticus]PYD54884.1 hypothetical protein CFR78_00195 [Komagataeibacter rhaeticus]